MIIEVLPPLPRDQPVYGRNRYAVAVSDLAQRRAAILSPNKQYLSGLCLGNFTIWPIIASLSVISALADAIDDIVQIFPKPKMGWVAAWRVVAMVEHINPIGDDSISQRPSQSVRFPPLFAIPCRAISAAICGLLPRPAGIGAARLIYFRPELVDGRRSEVCIAMVAEAAIMLVAQAVRLVLPAASGDLAKFHGSYFASYGGKAQ